MWRTNNARELGTFSTNTQSDMTKCWPFRNQGFTLITTGFTGTVKFYASNAPQTWGTAPDLSASADATNEFAVVQSINLQDGASIDGATWVPFTTNTSVTRYEVNDNNTNWIWIKTSWVSAWNVVIRLDLTDNQ